MTSESSLINVYCLNVYKWIFKACEQQRYLTWNRKKKTYVKNDKDKEHNVL